MPTYCYRVKKGAKPCGRCSEIFEVTQKYEDEPLGNCPDCGANVERIITTCNYVRGFTTASILSSERLKKTGLRKMVKDDNGNYVDGT